jgi:hypothetical protein
MSMGPQSLGEMELRDPLDGHLFTHRYALSTNGLGGYDSDGCAYARGIQPRTYGVATSPTTLYSALVEDWPPSVPEDKREGLLAILLGLGKDIQDARKMRPSERYELAAVTATQLGRPDFAVGELYLIAAWTVRDTIVGFFPGVQGAGDAWEKLAELVPMAQSQVALPARTRALFDMARLSHRGGFGVERDDFLQLLDTFDDAGLGAMEKRTEFLRRVAQEERLLAKARERFRRGLAAGEGTGEEQAHFRFLIGDMSRRLGDFDSARTDLEAADLSTATSDETRAFARDVLKVIKVQARPPKESNHGG